MSRRATRAGGAWSAQFGRIRLPWQPPVAAFHYLDPPMSPLLVLIVAVLAPSYAGPIVRLPAAPALAVIGASLIGLGDARLSSGALGGDILALLGALTGAGYYVIGRRVRQTVGIWRYATAVYAVAAAALALLALARSMPLVGFAGRDWTVFGAMAAGPMLIGHTGMNYALRHFRATTVNVAALGEPVGASVIAWLVPSIHEVPPPAAVLGGILVLLGVGLSVRAGK